MKKRVILLAALVLSALCLLSGCSGNPLPGGMDETALLTQGRAVVTALNEGQWQEIYDQLRQDAQATTSADGIRDYMSAVLEEAGAYESEEETLLTGQTLDSGEEYATAVFYCQHEKDDVMYRIAFSTELELMGLQVQKR